MASVTASYGASEVLGDIDLCVPPGRVVALLGANGAGKTTLLRICSGLLSPRDGRVILDGTDITGATPHRLAGLGLCHIPEGRAVFPKLTVAENLRLMTSGDPAEAIDKATQAFPVLGRKLRQAAGTMSGGEQQMLALVRAYITEPRYVLLDEVSMGLAPKVVDDIFEFLARLSRQGTALLVVEQYIAKALAFADLCYVLRTGRIVYVGEPSEIDHEAVARSYLGAGQDPLGTAATPGAPRR